MKAAIFFLVLMLCVDSFLFMGATAVQTINPDKESSFYPYTGTLIKEYDAGNQTLSSDPNAILAEVSGAQSVSEETGGVFTDIFNGVKSFFTSVGQGVKYLFMIVNALPSFLSAVGAPEYVVFSIGAMWHGITIFLIVLLMFGRDT